MKGDSLTEAERSRSTDGENAVATCCNRHEQWAFDGRRREAPEGTDTKVGNPDEAATKERCSPKNYR